MDRQLLSISKATLLKNMRAIRIKKMFHQQYYLGCIIYLNQLRYALIKRKLKEIKILDCGKLALPLKSNTIKSLKNLRCVKKSHTCVGVSNELSHLKLITVDNELSSEELEQYIKSNVFRFFKYANKALYLDYRLIAQNFHLLPVPKHQKYVQVLAARKQDINEGLLTLHRLKIKFPILSIEAVALIQLIKKFFQPLPIFYLLVFFEKEIFSILAIEKSFLIYKNHHRFISKDKSIRGQQVVQAVTLIQSVCSSVNFEQYIVIGDEKHIILPHVNHEKFKYFNMASFITTNISDEKLSSYYSAIGLTL